MSASFSGRFVWRELVTANPAAAAAYYKSLFGWSSKTVPMGPMDYTILRNDQAGQDVGGATKPAMEGVPSHWLTYVTVDDVDAAMAAIPGLGGQVLVPAMDVPGTGRFGIAMDPTGAVFAPFKGENPGVTDTDSRPADGTWCWAQLMTDDVAKAADFYCKLVGWTRGDMGGMTTLSVGESARGTIMAYPAGSEMPSAWLNYVSVADCDASFQTAVSAGGTPYTPPTDIAGMGRFAVLADPTGAVFALWKQVG